MAGQLITDGSVQWIVDDIRDGHRVGDVVLRHVLRSGYVKANGALVNRADYPRLWKFANDNALTVTEVNWTAGYRGMFGAGDGSTTFRIPDFRGDFIRGLDDGRGVDASRVLGTEEKGTLIGGYDDDSSGYNNSLLAGGAVNYGSDTLITSDYTYASGKTQYGTSMSGVSTGFLASFYAVARPRNIALIAQIKY